jgi:hypothetical protein
MQEGTEQEAGTQRAQSLRPTDVTSTAALFHICDEPPPIRHSSQQNLIRKARCWYLAVALHGAGAINDRLADKTLRILQIHSVGQSIND